jgi:hypothetical protein
MDPKERLTADSSFLDYRMMIQQKIPDFNPPAETQSSFVCNFNNQVGMNNHATFSSSLIDMLLQ